MEPSRRRQLNKVELLILALETRVKSLEMQASDQSTMIQRLNWALVELEKESVERARETLRNIRSQQQFQGIGDSDEDDQGVT